MPQAKSVARTSRKLSGILMFLLIGGQRELVYLLIMPLSAQVAIDLAQSTTHEFSDWPNSAVPAFGAGVYTIWHNDGRFIYVGMSGRGITVRNGSSKHTPWSLHTTPKPRQWPTQWRSVLCLRSRPPCPADTIAGRHRRNCLRASSDGCVRASVHPQNLCYRFVMLPDGAAAYAVETAIKNGEWENGRPLLNPGR